MATRDKAANQLMNHAKTVKTPDVMTTGTGMPIDDKLASLTVGERGPILIQDFVYTDEMAHFNRERIPERVVHAKGAGAFGYFECTHDISKYTKAVPFDKVGKKTKMLIRFSTVGRESGSADTARDPRGFAMKFYTEHGNWDLVGNNTPIFFIRDGSGESGSADTARDPRGFAMKFYTEHGNWDLVGNNTPIFFIRDPMHFPNFIHTQKRNPVTHCKDPDMFWDFITLRPETTHQVCFLFSDRGTPNGYRHMNGYGSHTFKMVNAAGEAVYCKFHMKTDQGIKNFMNNEAVKLSGENPDYALRDLYNNIADGNFPSWSVFIQIMTFDQAEKFRYNPFDLTKIWPHSEYPLIPTGKIVLNQNPENYFADIEQSAFAPIHMIPGIEASPDKMLQGLYSYPDTHHHRLGSNYHQIPVNCPLRGLGYGVLYCITGIAGRLYSYPDTHRHRLGSNYLQIPVNCPLRGLEKNYQRDGPQCVTNNQSGAPNYFPNSFNGPRDDLKYADHSLSYSGQVQRYRTDDTDNYSQVTNFWAKVLNAQERDRLVSNIAGHLKDAAPFIQDRAVRNFSQVHADFGSKLQALLKTQSQSKI